MGCLSDSSRSASKGSSGTTVSMGSGLRGRGFLPTANPITGIPIPGISRSCRQRMSTT